MANGGVLYAKITVVEIHGQTDKAFHCEVAEGELHWFAKSQIRHPSIYAVGQKNVEMELPVWLLKRLDFEIEGA